MMRNRWYLALAGMVVVLFLLSVFVPGSFMAMAEMAKKNVKVALINDGRVNDHGWSQASYEGLKLAGELPGVKIAHSEQIHIPDFESALRDYASKGYDLVINHSSIAKDAVINTAQDFPNTMFLWTDGDTVKDNIAVIVPLAQEAAYLAGVLAAGMTQTGTVGIVGSIDIPSTHRAHEGFKLGVKAANPKVKVLENWVGSFMDIAADHEAALSQIESGADIIFTDDGSLGVVAAGKEKKVYIIGSIWDQNPIGPEVVLTSVTWGFDEAIRDVVKELQAGTLQGKFYNIDLAHGARLAPYYGLKSKIPQAVQDQVETARKKILSGEIKVPVVN